MVIPFTCAHIPKHELQYMCTVRWIEAAATMTFHCEILSGRRRKEEIKSSINLHQKSVKNITLKNHNIGGFSMAIFW